MPIRSPKGAFVEEVVKVRKLAEEAGRDPQSFSITVMNAPQTPGELAELGELGIERVVFAIWPQEPDAALSELDRLSGIADSFLGST